MLPFDITVQKVPVNNSRIDAVALALIQGSRLPHTTDSDDRCGPHVAPAM